MLVKSLFDSLILFFGAFIGALVSWAVNIYLTDTEKYGTGFGITLFVLFIMTFVIILWVNVIRNQK